MTWSVTSGRISLGCFRIVDQSSRGVPLRGAVPTRHACRIGSHTRLCTGSSGFELGKEKFVYIGRYLKEKSIYR